MPYLDADNQAGEEVAIEALVSAETRTPKEREAAAWPLDVGDYWPEWNTFRTAQRLFSDEVAQIDSDAWDKQDKKMLGVRTVAIHQWFHNLPKSMLQEAEQAVESWNHLGCPNKDRQNM